MKFVVTEVTDGTFRIGDSSEKYGNGIEGGCENAPKILTIPSKINENQISIIGRLSFYKCTKIEQNLW